MNPPKCEELDYINFLIAAQQVFSSVEASRTHPAEEQGPAHDAYTRLLKRVPPDSQVLWQEVAPLIERKRGVLVIDDSTLDKPYASKMALVTRHWSGKHGRVVQGINLISLVWTDSWCRLPCDFRLYHKVQDGLTKNDHFQQMVKQAKARGFSPEMVAFDSWYSGLPNLKLLRALKWDWLTQLKANREVSKDRTGNRAIRDMFIPVQGCLLHLKGYGWVKVFRTVGTNGDAEYWATSHLDMTLEQAAFYALDAWQVEVYHRGLKQFTGIERAQYRLEVSQRNHIGLAIRAFVRLEFHRLHTGISWFEAKTSIIRAAMRLYLAQPSITLCSTA
jgi:DDE superfamily endonuclease